MLIRHLFYFITLSRQGHFAKAAEACNITQPTLSSALRKLEEDFGVRLVERDQHFVGLTPEGDRVLAWAQQILSDFESLKDDLSSSAEDLNGTLRLGVIPAAMPITGLLSEHFLKVHPAAHVEIISMSSRKIQSGLDSLELHGGLTYVENEPLQRVHQVPLYRERYVVISRRGHFRDHKPVPWGCLEKEPLCLLGPEMQNRRILDAAALRQGATLRPQITANSYLTIFAHLLSGKWVSIVPASLSEVYRLDDLLDCHQIADETTSQAIGLVVPDRQPMAKMTHAIFSAILMSNKSEDWDHLRTGGDKNSLSSDKAF
ncbi:MAG: LysR family transcriptional regulator [Pseudomonadota bacterium]